MHGCMQKKPGNEPVVLMEQPLVPISPSQISAMCYAAYTVARRCANDYNVYFIPTQHIKCILLDYS